MTKMKYLGGHPSGITAAGEFTYIWKDGKPDQIVFKNGACKCSVHITSGPPTHPRWHWNGNLECPTLSPSIGCDAAPRCGWHGHIIDGEIKP
jgi:hypothetical protein